MDSPAAGRNRFLGFGGRKKDSQQSDDDDDSDYNDKPKKSKRGGKKVGFAKDDSDIFRKTSQSKSTLKKTKNRPRGQSVDSYAASDADKTSIRKKFGVMFKSSSRSEDDVDRGRSMKRSTAKEEDYGYGNDNGNGRGSNTGGTITQSFTLDGIGGGGGGGGRNMPPQLPPEFPAATTNLSAAPMMHAPGERARYSVYHGSGGGFTGAAKPVKRKFRVRPYHCFDEPVNMTEEEIYKDSLKPSKTFEPLATYIKPPSKVNRGLKVPESTSKLWGTPEADGRLGSFKIELLGCIGLGRPKPDVCVYFVCADMAFCTDVVTSYRSPMWPYASRRAATFPINHAYAQVYIGVFDCKSRKNKENDVFCGRIVIDIAALRPETEYDVTFPLRHSTFIYDRRQRGVIRLRFGLHWFNERAAVISYFKNPKSIVTTSPLIQGQPTVPCSDPKTFRNVAVTCHGIDLPGKYTRGAFRATMREFNLYQLNLRQVAKVMMLDAVLYERPLVSFYMFFAGMHCIIASSARLVPPYWVGFLLIQLILNHQFYIEGDGFNLGYKPLTLWEIAKALLYRTDRDFPCLEPAFIAKRTKQRKNKDKANKKEAKDGDEQNVEYDHREFPFSERDTYPKFAVEDSLAPSTSSKARRESTTRMHGRLSVYYSAAPPTQADVAAGGEEDEDESSDESDGDEETVMGDGMAGDTGMYGLDDEAQDEDEELQGKSRDADLEVIAPKAGLFERDPHKKRLKVGPLQDSDKKGKTKTPPQVHLKKVETKLHKISLGLSVELIHPPPSYDQPEKAEANLGSSAARKQVMDDFDKLLGLNERSANPINRIASSFLGPLMRMIRIAIYFVRIGFHLTTWRDPYLTFWLFIILSTLCLILIMFPWRTFFSIVTIALVGPQNLFVRVYLAKKALKKKQKEEEEKAAKLKKEMEEADVGLGYAVDYGYGDAAPEVAMPDEREFDSPKDTPKKTGLSFWQRKFGARDGKDDDDDGVEMKSDRPVFSSTVQGSVTARKTLPRSVAIPYSRFKKDRFFDWPPDPTVSRATPLIPWQFDVPQQQQAAPNPNEPTAEMIMAATEKRAQRAELRRRIAAANRNQTYAAEN